MTDAPLAQSGLFEGLSDELIEALLQAAQTMSVRGGDTLVHQGEQADDLYYVESGRFRVVVNQKELVANVGSGEIIGELAFFAGGIRTADVIAERDSIVLGISRRDFDALARQHPELNSTLLALIASRLAKTTSLIRSMG